MAEHVRKKEWFADNRYTFVCAGCVNTLGFNVDWDRAEKVGHIVASYDEIDEQIREAFESVPDMMGGLRAVYALGQEGQVERDD